MKTTPILLFASMLAAVAAPLHAAQPEWRSWGGGDPSASARVADGAAPAPTPSQTIINEIMQRQQQLQLEVRELRDLVERQGYEIEMLRKANKDSYADTDRRLRLLPATSRPPMIRPSPCSRRASTSSRSRPSTPSSKPIRPAPMCRMPNTGLARRAMSRVT